DQPQLIVGLSYLTAVAKVLFHVQRLLRKSQSQVEIPQFAVAVGYVSQTYGHIAAISIGSEELESFFELWKSSFWAFLRIQLLTIFEQIVRWVWSDGLGPRHGRKQNHARNAFGKRAHSQITVRHSVQTRWGLSVELDRHPNKLQDN